MAHANARHSEVGAIVNTKFGGSDAILRVEGSPSARTRSRSGNAGLPSRVLAEWVGDLLDVYRIGCLPPRTRPLTRSTLLPSFSRGVWWQPAYRNKQRQCLAAATAFGQSFPNEEP
jgi:hypothetical protein